jgi:MFS family permease
MTPCPYALGDDLQNASISTPAMPTHRQAWWGVSVFSAAALLSYTDRQILNLLVDPIRHDLAISDTQMSLLQGAAFAVLYCVVGLPLGRCADVLPRRAIILAGIALWSVGTAACGLADSFGALFASRLCVGIGEAALAPAALSMIADYFAPERRGTAIGVFLTGMVVGSGASVAFGALLLHGAQQNLFAWLPFISQRAPWREVLLILGLIGIPVFVMMLSVREPARGGLRAAASHSLPLSAVVSGFLSRRATLGPLYIALAVSTVSDYALFSWTPAFLMRKFSWAADAAGLALGISGAVFGILGTLTGGVIADCLARGGVHRRLLVASVAAALTLTGGLVGLSPGAPTLLALFSIWVFASSMVGTVGIAVLQELLPHPMRGLGSALVSFGNTILGLGLGPTLVALCADYVYRSPASVGLATSTVVLPATLVTVLLFGRARRALRPDTALDRYP